MLQRCAPRLTPRGHMDSPVPSIHSMPPGDPKMSKRLLLSTCAVLTLCLLTAGVAAAGTAKAAWPSLQTQLAQDRVPAGSALATLIASNQDFQMLRPEEAYDKLAVPPWLRVLWLKEH